MELEVFEEKEEKKEPIYLKLAKEEQGIRVDAVNKKGDRVFCGQLVRFNCDGTLTLFSSINETKGFQLDKRERLVLSEREW